MAADFITPKHWLNDIARTKEVAERIDNALANARLEGAEAMQAKCADVIEDLDGNTYADHLRALDPQQVIDESVK